MQQKGDTLETKYRSKFLKVALGLLLVALLLPGLYVVVGSNGSAASSFLPEASASSGVCITHCVQSVVITVTAPSGKFSGVYNTQTIFNLRFSGAGATIVHDNCGSADLFMLSHPCRTYAINSRFVGDRLTINALAQDQAFFVGQWKFTPDPGSSSSGNITVRATVHFSDGSQANMQDKTVSSSSGSSVTGSFNFTCSQTLC